MKRGKPLTRRTPLKAKMRINHRRPTPRRSERVHDIDYMMAVKQLPCCARYLGRCQGVIEADHAGRRPMGRKCSDDQCIPLCTLHHRQRTDFSGPFKTWDQVIMRDWLATQVARTQERVFALLATGKSDTIGT